MKYPFPRLIAALLLALFVSAPTAGATPDEHDEAVRSLLQARGMIRAGRRLEAMDKLRSSLTLADQTAQHLTAALALANMAEIYRLYDNPAKAIDLYREALERYRAIGNRSGMEATQKKIEELGGPKAEPLPEVGRATRIDQAIERVRNRLQGREGSQQKSLEAQYAAYLQSVKKAITSSWTYPELALRNRKEGRVEVEFTILQDGSVDAVRVAQTSGHASMDLAAVNAVKAAAPFARIPEQLGIQRLDVGFTFNYVLE